MQVLFRKSNRLHDGQRGRNLLAQAEAAGVRAPSGCRMGICHSCRCKKLSGVVRNELTGVVSNAHDEDIQLCVTTPLSSVVLDL